jgi:hypothetical protein
MESSPAEDGDASQGPAIHGSPIPCRPNTKIIIPNECGVLPGPACHRAAWLTLPGLGAHNEERG